jgi:hypothetical protein
MESEERDERDREKERDRERYRQAAVEALGQLEWCVDYLYSLRKPQIARAISRNRHKIIERAGF